MSRELYYPIDLIVEVYEKLGWGLKKVVVEDNKYQIMGYRMGVDIIRIDVKIVGKTEGTT